MGNRAAQTKSKARPECQILARPNFIQAPFYRGRLRVDRTPSFCRTNARLWLGRAQIGGVPSENRADASFGWRRTVCNPAAFRSEGPQNGSRGTIAMGGPASIIRTVTTTHDKREI